MAVQQGQGRRYTIEEYLDLEWLAETKSEYLAGGIYAMAGGSPRHAQLAFNVSGAIAARLRGGPCRGYSSDAQVRAGPLVAYPDVTIVCGEPRCEGKRSEVLLNPTVLVEVLSASTEAFDRGRKWTCYQEVESLQHYVLVSQDTPRAEVYTRLPDGSWQYTAYVSLETEARLDAIGCTLPLAEVYGGVELETPAAPPVSGTEGN